MEKESGLRITQSKEINFNKKFFKYALHLEEGAGNRLLIIIPGMGSNTRSQERALRKIKDDMGADLYFNSLTLKFTESPFNLNQAMAEIEKQIKEISTTYKINKAVLMGSSLGAGYALRLAQRLFAEDSQTIEIDGLILMMPCINERSIKGNSVSLLKQLPPFLAKSGLRFAYKAKEVIGYLIQDSFEPGESIDAKYDRLISIPSFSSGPLHPKLVINLLLSENDLLIDNRQVIKDLEKITSKNNINIHNVYPTGVNNHDFKPQEWIDEGRKLFIPTLMQIWQ
ncbi:MAG: hypothetical protein Q7S61_02085 [bacterium]|nr:hypothetical protein [bacterium]